jgi:hypothetical protein
MDIMNILKAIDSVLMEVMFESDRVKRLDPTDPELFVAIQSGGQAAARNATVQIVFLVALPGGRYNVRRLLVASTTLVEGAANTFEQVTLDSELSEKFTAEELDAGVWPIGFGFVDIQPLGDASAGNTQTYTQVQLTTKTQAALVNPSDSSLLGRKVLRGCSGAAAGCINFMIAERYPPSGKVAL